VSKLSQCAWSRPAQGIQSLAVVYALAYLASLNIVSCAKATESGGDNCSKPSDCPAGKQCNVATGQCEAPVVFGSGGSGSITTSGTGSSSGTDGSGGGSTVGTLPPSEGGVRQVDPQVPTDLAADACSGWTTELESLPAILEFVLDSSLSMAERKQGNNWVTNGGSGQSKWEICRDSVKQCLDGLSPSVAVGEVFFPNHAIAGNYTSPQSPTVCFDPSNAVPIGILGSTASPQRAALAGALDGVQAAGNTPTWEAYYYAVTQMQIARQTFEGQPYVVLMTDGIPTYGQSCVGSGREDGLVPTQPIVDLITAAWGVGIKTFVIGSPGSENGANKTDSRGWLSRAAREGHTDTPGCSDSGPNYCHMDMSQSPDFSATLRAGLGVISSQLGNCEYAMPSSPSPDQVVDVSKLNVFVTNDSGTYLVMPSTQADCTEGWQIVDGNIKLCPASCDRAQADFSAHVQILAGCSTPEVIAALPPIT
jgi:hypothetical protein